MKKKYLAMLMAVSISAMPIVGCGSSDSNQSAKSDTTTTQSSETKEDNTSKSDDASKEEAKNTENTESSDEANATEEAQDTGDTAENTDEANATEETQDTSEVVESSDALNVAEDTFEMPDLVTKVGEADADMLALLGVSEAADSYNTKLFGADVTIVVESKDGNVESVQLTFPSVSKDSLINAISEQLGADGTEESDKTSWSYEDRNVVLTEGEQGNVVTISQ